MTVLHKVQVLRIKKCSDFMMWYLGMVGQFVPHLGWSPLHGYKSRDSNGHTNFVLSDDAEPATVHVQTHELEQWPFNCHMTTPHCQRKAIITVERESKAWPHIVKGIGASGSPNEPVATPSGQTQWQSMFETVANIGTGFLLSLVVTHYVLPWYGHHVSYSENLQITAIFTLVSIVRSYFFRRIFNHIQTKL